MESGAQGQRQRGMIADSDGSASQAAWRTPRVRHARRRVAGALVIAGLCAALAACGSGSGTGSVASPTASASGGTGGGTSTPVATQPGPTDTPFDFGTPSAIQGATDACAQTTATPSASLPNTIPAYPGAQVSIGSVNGANGVFGLCATDTVSAVDSYYVSQLTAHGWQKLTNTTLQSSQQLTASQSNTNLIITISPDTALPGKTEVLIIYSGT